MLISHTLHKAALTDPHSSDPHLELAHSVVTGRNDILLNLIRTAAIHLVHVPVRIPSSKLKLKLKVENINCYAHQYFEIEKRRQERGENVSGAYKHYRIKWQSSKGQPQLTTTGVGRYIMYTVHYST